MLSAAHIPASVFYWMRCHAALLPCCFCTGTTPSKKATALTSTAATAVTVATAAFPSTTPAESVRRNLHRPAPLSPNLTRLPLKYAVLKGCGTLALPLMLSACSWSWFGLNSPPRTVSSHATGWLSVAPARDFVYLPARDGHMSANRIENTAMTGIVLKDDINGAVRDSVARSLRVAGFHLDDGRKVLSGSIEKFSVDDARSPTWWTLKMRYMVTDSATRKVVFTTTRTVRHKAPKFTSSNVAIEDTVRSSVEALIGDPGFIRSVN